MVSVVVVADVAVAVVDVVVISFEAVLGQAVDHGRHVDQRESVQTPFLSQKIYKGLFKN